MKFFLPFLVLLSATAATAAPNDVTLNNAVFVEHVRVDAQGRRTVALDPPQVVTPGDHLVFVLTYRNGGAQPATGFAVTNPIPPAVAFERSDDANAVVSVDGGRTWGALAALTVAQPDGSRRPAVAADVTHVRWAFSQPIPAGAEGRLSFRGIVK
jgi:uncharacterized repeat protein (TIGR01451 family)